MSLPANTPGTCYKFVVSSANEAASVIRDRLGENARVLSVRTIEPTGLRSLWGAPKIEVLATIAAVATAPTTLNVTSADKAVPESGPLSLARPAVLAGFHRPIATDLRALLRRSGFSDSILARLQKSSD